MMNPQQRLFLSIAVVVILITIPFLFVQQESQEVQTQPSHGVEINTVQDAAPSPDVTSNTTQNSDNISVTFHLDESESGFSPDEDTESHQQDEDGDNDDEETDTGEPDNDEPPDDDNGDHIEVEPGELQQALDDARPGDTLRLKPGTYLGPFTLPKKDGEAWIVIRSDINLPQGRIGPGHNFAKITAPQGKPGIRADPGAHHYKLIGLEVLPEENSNTYGLIILGDDSNQERPHHIMIDRSYLHGDPAKGSRRGVAANGEHITVMNSYFSDFKGKGEDTQTIAGWNGEGPFTITNNYLEAAGENIIFGGTDPADDGLVPHDITIRGNHFFKPLQWNPHHPAYGGERWTVKNLLELKNARDVRIEENLFEHNWAGDQSGFAIVLTPRNQEGTAPWSVVEDVTFENNIVRGSAAGINILGEDDNYQSKQTNNIRIKNNLFYDIGAEKWGGRGRMIQQLGPTTDITFDHNTFHSHGTILHASRDKNNGFVFTNNIVWHRGYGIYGGDYGAGDPAISHYFPDGSFNKNVFIGPWPSDQGVGKDAYSDLHADNFFVDTQEAVGFEDIEEHNYALEDSSYSNAGTDQEDIGVDMDELCDAC